MKYLKSIILAMAIFVGFANAVFAADHGTKEEATALVEAALLHIKRVGPEKAFEDFTNDKINWTKKDLYVFVNDLDSVSKANGGNPKLVGKSLAELKDPNGKEFAKEMSNIVIAKGEGWVDYAWFNPVAKKVEGKTSFVKRIPGVNALVGVGVYR